MNLGFKVQTKIRKPVSEVFDAIVKPEHLNKYFTHSARGELTNGAKVFWNWSNHLDGTDVLVEDVVPNEKIQLSWSSCIGIPTTVLFHFKETDDQRTLITIEESGWPMDQKGIEASYDNCSGWENMSTCLKAHLQYGLDLRY